MYTLHKHEDLEDYVDFIETQEIAGRPLTDRIAEIQYLYLRENQPWVVAFSGGKDSHALLTIMYFALLGLDPSARKYPVHVVFCDTLAEAPPYLHKVMNVINAVGSQAKRDGIPLETRVITPKAQDTFWSRLLGRGYPAPNLKTNRWCTDKIKLQPFRDFTKSFFKNGEDPIVVIGSRSQESKNREQIIKKYHGDTGYFDASDPDYRRYAPIKDWSVQDVWRVLGQHIQENQYDALPKQWSSPWGQSNIALVNLYDSTSSDAGECPLVESNSSPGCGKSRFGCWSCTVVTKDKAIDGLILHGETWLKPLADFRNFLHSTTEPTVKKLYRNDRRRDGYVKQKTVLLNSDKEEDLDKELEFVQGPYYMHFRKEWLKQLLEMEKSINEQGHNVKLITEDELHEIRFQWRIDPLEPDWEDELPQIYNSVYGVGVIHWKYDDNNAFGELESRLINTLAIQHSLPADLVKKLIELEVSMSGLNKRHGIFNKIESLLRQDWAGIEEAKQKRESENATLRVYKRELENIESMMREVQKSLDIEVI